MKKRQFVSISALVAAASIYSTSSYAIGFNCITDNGMTNYSIDTCAIAEAQMQLDVSNNLDGTVTFTFSNNDVGTSTDFGAFIGEVYFYDGVYIDGSSSVVSGSAGVNFVTDPVKPANLPSYNPDPLTLFASADSQAHNRVDVGEFLYIQFNMWEGITFNEMISAIDSGNMVIGIHAKGLAEDFTLVDGESESLITTTVVPVPAAAWLFGTGVIGLAGIARRKKA